jgi:hypothetical protein
MLVEMRSAVAPWVGLVVFAPAVCVAEPPPLDVLDPWAEPVVARFDASDPWDELTIGTLDIVDPWDSEVSAEPEPEPEPFVADPWASDVPTATFPPQSEEPRLPTARFPWTP